MYCHNSAFLFSDSTFGFEIVTVYSYDAEGLRTEMEENDRLIKFLYDGDKVIAESDTSKGLQRFIRGYGLVSSDCEEARTYYHYASDDLSSITDIIGHDGTVLNHYEYDAFGNFEIKEEQVSNRFGYAGEQYDPATNLYYLRARFFNPVIGRFIQEDTYYGDGLNLYAYCHNNPVGYVDPSGHDGICSKKYQELKNAGYSPQEAYMLAKAEFLERTQGPEAAKNYLESQVNKKGLSGPQNNNPQKVSYGDQYTKNGRKKVLKPDAEYTTPDGYTYRTDSQGRLINASGDLNNQVAKRNGYAQSNVGKGNGRKSYDDGGHLIASIFHGSGNKDNLVPMNSNLNRGDWKSMENVWADAIKHNQDVNVNIKPIYTNGSQRPSAFYVEYRIDNGKTEYKYFTNN